MDIDAFMNSAPPSFVSARTTSDSLGFTPPTQMRNMVAVGLDAVDLLSMSSMPTLPFEMTMRGTGRRGLGHDFEGSALPVYVGPDNSERVEPLGAGVEQYAAALCALESAFQSAPKQAHERRMAMNAAVGKAGIHIPNSISEVSRHHEESVHSSVGALSLAACGGPVGAVITLEPIGRAIAVHSAGDGRFTLLDPNQDPRGSGFPPLGGFSAVYEEGHTPHTLSAYLTRHYPSMSAETVIFVPGMATPVPSVSSLPMEELAIEPRAAPAPVPEGSVAFEPSEPAEVPGKRKHPQPSPDSPMRVESEESEEKRARTPPVVTTAIPSAAVAAPKPRIAGAARRVSTKASSTETTEGKTAEAKK